MTKIIDIIIPKINFSGVSITSQIVANHLYAAGWKINFVVLRKYNDDSNFLNKNIKLINLSPVKNHVRIFEILYSMLSFAKYIFSRKQIPLMIWGKEYSIIGLVLRKILLRKNIIIGVNVNNIKLHLSRSSQISFFIKNAIYKKYIPQMNYWIAQSEGIRDEMIMDYAVEPEKASICYPAVQITPSKNDYAEKQNEIIFIGRLTDQKNPLLALEYAIEFLNNNPTYRFRILGDGELLEDMQKTLKECDISKRVIFEGFVKNITDYLNQAKAMILTSHYEGFGMVLIESISCGVPVISLNCPSGPREIIKNDINGYLITEDDNFVEKISLAVTKNWDTDIMRQSIKQFMPEYILPQYEKILSSVIKEQQ